jgi:hypothetical protein
LSVSVAEIFKQAKLQLQGCSQGRSNPEGAATYRCYVRDKVKGVKKVLFFALSIKKFR